MASAIVPPLASQQQPSPFLFKVQLLHLSQHGKCSRSGRTGKKLVLLLHVLAEILFSMLTNIWAVDAMRLEKARIFCLVSRFYSILVQTSNQKLFYYPMLSDSFMFYFLGTSVEPEVEFRTFQLICRNPLIDIRNIFLVFRAPEIFSIITRELQHTALRKRSSHWSMFQKRKMERLMMILFCRLGLGRASVCQNSGKRNSPTTK